MQWYTQDWQQDSVMSLLKDLLQNEEDDLDQVYSILCTKVKLLPGSLPNARCDGQMCYIFQAADCVIVFGHQLKEPNPMSQVITL